MPCVSQFLRKTIKNQPWKTLSRFMMSIEVRNNLKSLACEVCKLFCQRFNSEDKELLDQVKLEMSVYIITYN